MMSSREIFAKHKAILAFNLLYFISFTVYFFMKQNLEFLWYVSVLAFFITLILVTLPKTQFSSAILWGLSLWGFFHLAGGGITVGDDVLYGFVFYPFFAIEDNWILKYDQVVHAYGFFVATLVGHHLMRPHLKDIVNENTISFLVFLIGIGFGALNEVIEFLAVVFIPDTHVGGYANTGVDLVANTLGAFGAIVYLRLVSKRK